jgi:hypothetical protein
MESMSIVNSRPSMLFRDDIGESAFRLYISVSAFRQLNSQDTIEQLHACRQALATSLTADAKAALKLHVGRIYGSQKCRIVSFTKSAPPLPLSLPSLQFPATPVKPSRAERLRARKEERLIKQEKRAKHERRAVRTLTEAEIEAARIAKAKEYIRIERAKS